MATQTHKEHDDHDLHVREDANVPYVWPRGPTVGSRTGQRVWQAISVVLLLALIALVAYMISKSR